IRAHRSRRRREAAGGDGSRRGARPQPDRGRGRGGPAHPALDLVAAWHLLETRPRLLLRDVLGCDELEWQRGKAWALEQAMGAIWYYVESNAAMSLMGRCTLERILADESSD
ncbi:MAG: hypothetical protein WBV06_04250, partial [Acidimicrobiia bacterium]